MPDLEEMLTGELAGIGRYERDVGIIRPDAKIAVRVTHTGKARLPSIPTFADESLPVIGTNPRHQGIGPERLLPNIDLDV